MCRADGGARSEEFCDVRILYVSDTVSAIGREGLGDSFELQIRYMLAKFVFTALE